MAEVNLRKRVKDNILIKQGDLFKVEYEDDYTNRRITLRIIRIEDQKMIAVSIDSGYRYSNMNVEGMTIKQFIKEVLPNNIIDSEYIPNNKLRIDVMEKKS